MDDQEKSNRPTTSDDSFENYYLQDNSLEDCYMNTAVSKFKVVSNCEEEEEEEEIEEGEVISEKYVNPKPEIGRRSQYSPESIIDFAMGSPLETTINGGGGWIIKGKRSPRYIVALKNHVESRKLDKESEAQKEEKFLLKKRKFGDEEKQEDFNGGETAVADNHTEEIKLEMPMKKKLMFKIKAFNLTAEKPAGIVSLVAEQKRVDNTTSATISESDIIKRGDADVIIKKDVIPKEYTCKLCGASFTTFQGLGGHKSSRHSVRVKREGLFSKSHKHAFKKQREKNDDNNTQEIHESNNASNGIGGCSSKDQIFFIPPKRVLDFDLNEPCPEQEID